MSAPLSHWLRSLAITVPAIAASAALAPAANAQNAPPKDPPAAKDAAKDAKEEAKDVKNDAKDAAKDVKDDVKDAAQDTKETARDKAQEAREDVRDTTRNARDNVRDAREDARDTQRDARDNVRDARDNARDTVRDPRDPKNPARDQSRDARDPENLRQPNRPEANRPDTVREDRRDGDNDAAVRFSAQGTRGADIGLWFERDASKGLVISDVGTRGAIAKLGFHEGDRIISVNGHKVTRENDFITYLFADDVRNERIKVIVVRDGREEVIIVEPSIFVEELSYVENDPLEHFGVIVDDRYNDRIVVWRVVPRSPAYYAGIRAGDVIISVGNQRLANVAAFVQRITGVDPGELQVQVNRGQATRTLHVDVPRFVNRTERRTSFRPNIDDRRDDRLDRRDDRIDDRQDRRDDRRDNRTDAPRLPNTPAPVTPAPAPAVPPTVTPAPAPAAPAAPAPGKPAPRPGLFPRGR